MYWLAISINAIVSVVLLFLILYAFYKIETTKGLLETDITDIHRKFTRLINAINSVILSEYNLDAQQDRKINELAKKP